VTTTKAIGASCAGATGAALDAERYERELAELLPAHEFFAPRAPLAGVDLEQLVSRALSALYGAEPDDQAQDVERAIRGLYTAAT